jgi:uncharacterized protein
MDWVAAYLLLGGTVGLLGGLFGIGGGTVLVPILLLLFDAQHFPPEHLLHLALGTSMATIIFTAMASLYKHHQHKAVNWPVVRIITPGILTGTALGALLSTRIPTQFLGLLFGLFVYFAAAQILLDLQPPASRTLPGKHAIRFFGVFAGALSCLVSIGGGTIVIPYLLWRNMDLRHAIGTSAAISFPVAIGGTAAYIATGLHTPGLPPYTLGYVYLPCIVWTAIASVMTAPLGAKAAHRMNIAALRKLFAVILLALATKLVFKVFT